MFLPTLHELTTAVVVAGDDNEHNWLFIRVWWPSGKVDALDAVEVASSVTPPARPCALYDPALP